MFQLVYRISQTLSAERITGGIKRNYDYEYNRLKCWEKKISSGTMFYAKVAIAMHSLTRV